MPSDEMRAIAAQIRVNNEASPIGAGSVEEMRARMEAQQSGLSLPTTTERVDLEIGGIPSCRIRAEGARDDRAVLYLHGGGYVMGSLDTHQELMGRISSTLHATVYGVDYRLAPETPWPGAVDDAVAAWCGLPDLGIVPEHTIVAGDSAGGGLTLALLLAIKERGDALPAGAVTFSPWTDLTGSGESLISRASADPMIAAGDLPTMAAHYVGDADPKTPTLSPLFGDLSGLPPLLHQVGDDEVLLDDSVRVHEASKAAGTDSTLHVFDGAFHVFQAVPMLPEAQEALDEMASFCEGLW